MAKCFIHLNIAPLSSVILSIRSYSEMDLKQASFGKALEKIAFNNTKWTDTVTTSSKTTHKPLCTENPKPLHYFSLPNNLCYLQEFNNILIYFFTREHSDNERRASTKAQFNLTLFTFDKKDGKNDKKNFTNLYGRPSAMTAGIIAK